MRSQSRTASALPFREALALGALHGAGELLPISSSAHLVIVPRLLRWRYSTLDPVARKTFEVALHTGSAAALVLTLGDEFNGLSGRTLGLIALSSAPPALVGYALEETIERRLGTPTTIAAGLLAGGIALWVADLSPQARSVEQAGEWDYLWMGLAQACALMPGVSRAGATITAARLRGFSRGAAGRLSRRVAMPVIAGAGALRLMRAGRRPFPAEAAAPLAAGTATAFLATMSAARASRACEHGRPLLPFSLYRALLAVLIVWRTRGGQTTTRASTARHHRAAPA